MNAMNSSRTLLIVYHSQSGNTERLAKAVEEGARRVAGVGVMLARAPSVTAHDLKQCRAVVICSPEYFGYMAGAVKDLFDRTYEEVREQTKGKSCAIVICAGNDGTGALNSIQRIILGYGLKMVQEPVICRGPIEDKALEKCAAIGQTVAAGMDLGIY